MERLHRRDAIPAPAWNQSGIRCTSTVSSRLWTSCDRADSDAWRARLLRKRLQRQRQSRWIRNLLNGNRLQRKSRKAELRDENV